MTEWLNAIRSFIRFVHVNMVNLHWGVIAAAIGAGSGLWALVLALHTQRRSRQALLSMVGWMMLLVGGVGCVARWPSFTPATPPATSPATFEPFVGAPPTTPAPTVTLIPTTALSAIPTVVIAQEPAASTAPAQLHIPSLNLEKSIRIVPIRDGLWDLDHLGADVGWLTTTGAYPEADWAMVLVGHITLASLERGAFADLEKIKRGAIISYQANGMEYVYEVREKGRVAPDDVKALYVPDGKVLLLMTCTDYSHLDRLYANRLLIRAELIEKYPLQP